MLVRPKPVVAWGNGLWLLPRLQRAGGVRHLPGRWRENPLEPRRFPGVLDEQHLPDWAAEKLAELRGTTQKQADGPAQGGMEMG